ncbi:MAG: 2-isopropylmalate synthase [Syntrophobacteraceae bacterium]|nr:2-isopropylmalate synthase [Syntrophobacteraceae bacterium]MCU0587534.1 2-isopropylmalate synthase [Syntrophobacteraceae bacterium]
MDRLFFFDTTLRDGVKAPGTVLTREEKIRIAKQLAHLQVDVIEPGFPAASEEQFAVCEQIAREVKGPVIAALARATNAKDFEIAWKAIESAASARLHTFVPASRQYREHFLRKSFAEVCQIAASAIKTARKLSKQVEFSLVDAFRAETSEVVDLVRVAVDAGATSVNLADTVGCALPADVEGMVSAVLAKVPGTSLSIHCHNDLGLAVANSLAAIRAGARQIHCTVNGIGERAGNAPLEELGALFALRSADLRMESGLKLDQIYPTSRLVRRLTGIGVQPHKPIVGSNAFLGELAAPQLADATAPPPFEIIQPEALGIHTGMDALGQDASLEALGNRLSELGYSFGSGEVRELYTEFQELALRKENVFDADLELLAGQRAPSEGSRYRLLYLNVTAGSISVPNATVQLEVDGEIVQDAGFGQGPVDAAFKTILRMVKRFPKLVRYEVNAVTPGADAQGEISLRLQENGVFVDGKAVGTDIVLASAQALIDGLNKLEHVVAHTGISEFTEEEGWLPRL